jgi:hypothetical protein
MILRTDAVYEGGEVHPHPPANFPEFRPTPPNSAGSRSKSKAGFGWGPSSPGRGHGRPARQTRCHLVEQGCPWWFKAEAMPKRVVAPSC